MFKKLLILNILCCTFFSCSDDRKETVVDNTTKEKSIAKPSSRKDILVEDSIPVQESNTAVKSSVDTLRKLPVEKKLHLLY